MSGLPAMTFGNFIRERREELGYTASEMSHKGGIALSSIGKWESDEARPFLSSLKKIAAVYELDVEQLIQFDIRHKKSNKYPPIRGVQAEIGSAKSVILRVMTGNSQFEINMRNQLITALEKCEAILAEIQFADSAF